MALNSYDLMDSLPEKIYDDITALAATICKTPVSLVNLVSGNRLYFKSNHGFNP